MKKIEIGDTVKLKFTSTIMIVTGFDGIFYKCEWVEDNKKNIGYFLASALDCDVVAEG